MTSFQQPIVSPVLCEQTTAQLTLQLTDEADVAIAKADLASLTLTLYDRATGTVLNGRNAQTVLDANGGSVSATGLVTLLLSDADNALASQSRSGETHVALLLWTTASGTRRGAKEIAFTVINQMKLI